MKKPGRAGGKKKENFNLENRGWSDVILMEANSLIILYPGMDIASLVFHLHVPIVEIWIWFGDVGSEGLNRKRVHMDCQRQAYSTMGTSLGLSSKWAF